MTISLGGYLHFLMESFPFTSTDLALEKQAKRTATCRVLQG